MRAGRAGGGARRPCGGLWWRERVLRRWGWREWVMRDRGRANCARARPTRRRPSQAKVSQREQAARVGLARRAAALEQGCTAQMSPRRRRRPGRESGRKGGEARRALLVEGNREVPSKARSRPRELRAGPPHPPAALSSQSLAAGAIGVSKPRFAARRDGPRAALARQRCTEDLAGRKPLEPLTMVALTLNAAFCRAALGREARTASGLRTREQAQGRLVPLQARSPQPEASAGIYGEAASL
jgi:hypothetical protein